MRDHARVRAEGPGAGAVDEGAALGLGLGLGLGPEVDWSWVFGCFLGRRRVVGRVGVDLDGYPLYIHGECREFRTLRFLMEIFQALSVFRGQHLIGAAAVAAYAHPWRSLVALVQARGRR